MKCCAPSGKSLATLSGAGSILALALAATLVVSERVFAADEGEVMRAPPVAYKTYTFTPGKLTGQEIFLEKENLRCRVFCFDQFRAFPKPKETVALRLSLRGGYRAHDLFGHDDFDPKEAQTVATGWVPQASGNFIIFPEQSKEHLPTWIPERTRMIRVPLVKQYGDAVVNAYDLALGLDRFNKGDDKSVSIPFQIIEATDDSGKKGKRLVPVNPVVDGVYYAYSLPDDRDTANYGFLFAVGNAGPSSGSSQTTEGQSLPLPISCLLPDVQLARDVLDYALLSQAAYGEKAVPRWEKEDDGNCPIAGLKCWEDIGVTGFQVQVYRQEKTLAVVFRGTEITKAEDILTDLENFFNLVPAQYVEAANFVREVVKKAGSEYNIILTGHSLGGGLASFAALCCGQPAIVFNAAGLGSGLRGSIPQQNLDRQQTLVKSLDLVGDPISALGGQVGTIYKQPVPVGMIGKDGFFDARTQVAIAAAALDPSIAGPPVATSLNPLNYHSIDTFVDVLRIVGK